MPQNALRNGHPRSDGPSRTARSRKAWALAVGFAVAAMLTACGSDDNPVDNEIVPFVQEGGVHIQVLESRGLPYTIAIPLDYDPNVELPLVVALHYGATLTPYIGGMFLEDLVGPALTGLGGIMVAPDAITGDFSNENAEADLLALLDAIEQNYKIAPGKTVLVGHSMGGAGVWYMAERHPDRFSVAIPVAARPPADLADMDWTVPVIILHSRDDEIIPYTDAETAYNVLQDKGITSHFIYLENVSHFDTVSYQQPLNATIPWIIDIWNE